jgi:hypothetical protein
VVWRHFDTDVPHPLFCCSCCGAVTGPWLQLGQRTKSGMLGACFGLI